MSKTIVGLDKKRLDAEKQLEKAMSKRWPVGIKVWFTINCKQKIPTSGTVLCYYPPYLRIKLHTNKEPAKDVHYKNVIGC